MKPRQTHTAYIALGSNLGDRSANLAEALRQLDAHELIDVRQVSSALETAPVGGPSGQGPYLNGAAELVTDLSAGDLLAALLDIEGRLGRRRQEHWGPRTVDLDLLLYDGAIIDEPQLKVPHPLMHKRVFVMRPLVEIAPDAWHPVLGKNARQLLDDLA